MIPLLIAHRGDHITFPENTVDAFASAFDKGADGVELDIQLIEGKIRVVHDYLADRSKIYPLLETVLQNFCQRGNLEIEVKAFSTDILKPLSELIGKYQPKDIELTTSELPLVPFIAEAFPERSIGVIFSESHFSQWMTEELYLTKTIAFMKLMNATVVHLSHLPVERLTATLIKALHEQKLKVHYHIFKTEMAEQVKLFDLLKKLAVDQCTFDDISLLEAIALAP